MYIYSCIYINYLSHVISTNKKFCSLPLVYNNHPPGPLPRYNGAEIKLPQPNYQAELNIYL